MTDQYFFILRWKHLPNVIAPEVSSERDTNRSRAVLTKFGCFLWFSVELKRLCNSSLSQNYFKYKNCNNDQISKGPSPILLHFVKNKLQKNNASLCLNYRNCGSAIMWRDTQQWVNPRSCFHRQSQQAHSLTAYSQLWITRILQKTASVWYSCRPPLSMGLASGSFLFTTGSASSSSSFLPASPWLPVKYYTWQPWQMLEEKKCSVISR